MESTVQDFHKKIDHLERLLRSESARKTQIAMTFRSFFKDSVSELQQHGAEKRALTNAKLTARFEETKRKLDEVSARIPIEEQAMLDSITERTEAIRKEVTQL